MKAILTLVFEKNISTKEQDGLQQLVNEKEDQALAEEFGIGWESPKNMTIEFTR